MESEETLTEYERKIKQLHAKIILKEEQIEKMRQDMIKAETKRAALTAQLAKTKVNAKREEVDRKFVVKNLEREKKESSKVLIDIQKKLIETEFKLHGANDELKSVREQLEASNEDANALRERLASSEKDLISTRDASMMIEKQYELSRRRELDDRKMKRGTYRKREIVLLNWNELASFKSVREREASVEESKECEELERKLVLSTQNIAKEQKLRAKVESERDEFRERSCIGRTSWESVSGTNFQVRKRTVVLCWRVKFGRERSNVEGSYESK